MGMQRSSGSFCDFVLLFMTSMAFIVGTCHFALSSCARCKQPCLYRFGIVGGDMTGNHNWAVSSYLYSL